MAAPADLKKAARTHAFADAQLYKLSCQAEGNSLGRADRTLKRALDKAPCLLLAQTLSMSQDQAVLLSAVQASQGLCDTGKYWFVTTLLIV